MGASKSKPEIEVSGRETAFFARRDAPVQFSDDFINSLGGTGLPSAETSPARQQTLDAHIQARINSELSRLQQEETSVREQIQKALEKENFEKEYGDKTAAGVSHSSTLLKDLEDLEKRAVVLREKINGKDVDAWKSVDEGRSSLIACFRANQTTPLNCKEEAEKFAIAVAGIEKTFVNSL